MVTLTPKAQATRDRIIACASDLFHLNGYHATGLDKIIAAAGVTKGNFYYYFNSKEALVLATLDDQFEKIAGEARVLMQASESPLENLFAVLNLMLKAEQESFEEGDLRGCFFGNLTLELSALSEPVQKKVKGIFTDMQALFAQLLLAAKQKGEIDSKIEPAAWAAFILSTVEGSLLLDKSQQEPGQLSASIDLLKMHLRSQPADLN